MPKEEIPIEREKKSFNGKMVDGRLVISFYTEYFKEDGSYDKSVFYDKIFDTKEEMNDYIDVFFE